MQRGLAESAPVLGVADVAPDQAVRLDEPDARRDRFQQRPIVRDKEHRSIVRRKRLLEDLLACDIEVVRWLVEEQKIALDQRDESQRHSTPLTTGEVTKLLLHVVSGEEEASEKAARLTERQRCSREDRVEHCARAVQPLLRLAIGGRLDVVPEIDLPRERGQLSADRSQERRLTASIGTDDRDLLAAIEIEILTMEERRVESDRQAAKRQHTFSARAAASDVERNPLRVLRALDSLLLDPLELPLTVLGLTVFLPDLVPADEVLVLLDRLFLFLERLQLLRPLDLPGRSGGFVALAVHGDTPQRDLPCAVGDPIEEMPVVRHEQDGALEAEKLILEPLERAEIEVIRRLVEQQEVRGLEECPRQRSARFFSAAQHVDALVVFVLSESNADERRPNSCVDPISSLPLEPMQKIVITPQVFFSCMCSDPLFETAKLGFDPPEVGEGPLHRLLQCPLGMEPGDLWQVGNARTADEVDLPLGRRLFPMDQTKQRRFADAVVADQGDPISTAHLCREGFEQHLRAERLAQSLDLHKRHDLDGTRTFRRRKDGFRLHILCASMPPVRAMNEAILYERLSDRRVRCHVCSHCCTIPAGAFGICRVRQNADGVLKSLVYERVIAQEVDPIEKKPLFHFYPGTLAYSVATVGCNFTCLNCQNSYISQYPREHNGRIIGERVAAAKLVAAAVESGAHSIAYTYTEPTIAIEYVLEAMALAKEAGLANVWVSNGYFTAQASELIVPLLDAANIDLKGISDSVYHEIAGANVRPVLDTIERLHEAGVWVEVTTLVIPDVNDTEEALHWTAEAIVGVSPGIPWHVSRFFPAYRMVDRPPTPIDRLESACHIGRSVGLRYVYMGNTPGEGEVTHCPQCGARVLIRSGYRIRENRLSEGVCPECGASIDGVWFTAG